MDGLGGGSSQVLPFLDTEDGDLRFAAREHEMETVVARAWAQRIVTVVIGEVDKRPHQVLLLSPPPPA